MCRRFLILLFGGLLMSGLCAQTPEKYVSMGLISDSMGKYNEAIGYFSKAIEQAPELSTAWYNRGGVRMKLKSYSLAVVDFNKAILLDTANWDAYFNRSLAYRYTYNYQFALADLNIYLQHYPNDLGAINERADLAIEMSEWPQAESDLKRLIKATGDSYLLTSRLVTVYVKQKKYTQAESLLTNNIVSNPDNLSYYYDRAIVRNYAGNYQGSIEDCNFILLKIPNDAQSLALKADNYFFLKDFNEAEDLYEDLFKKDTLNADLMADYGHCLLQTGKYTLAEQLLTRSIRLKGNNLAYAYLGRGIARFNLNRGQEACGDWQRSLTLGEAKANDYLKQYCSDQKQHNE